jgi:KDO2-lipid IV(A) lauroyltransferase
MVTVSGHEQFLPLVQQQRPFLLLAPHFIGLDAAATRLSMEFPCGATLYTPQRDLVLNTIINAGRTRFNKIYLVNRRDGVRSLIQHLQQGRPVYYLPDMDFGHTGTIFAPFFGIPASTLIATAQIARKWRLPVFPIITFWHATTGRYHVEVLPALKDFPGHDTLEAATARLNQTLEQWIHRCPPQYYWVHRRFKTRPVGEQGFY